MFKVTDISNLQSYLKEIKGGTPSDNKLVSLLEDAFFKIRNCDVFKHLQYQKCNPYKDIEIISVVNSDILFTYQKKCLNVKYSLCFWKGSLSLLVVLIDESAEQRNSQLEMLNQYKDKLLARVSHDLKTPLNCILSITDHIKTQSSQLSDQIKIIHNNSILLLHMINDILDHTQIKYKKLRLNISQFNLKEIILEIFDIFSFQIASQKILLLLEGDFEDVIIQNDKNRLKQILINLISNSIKFTSEGYVKVKCNKMIENQTIQIQVSDTGAGMNASIMESLFKEFGSFNQSNLNTNGIGLGLVICKQLVGLLGKNDNIYVSSQIGKGSSFTFEILQTNFQEKEKQNSCHNIQTATVFQESNIKFFPGYSSKKLIADLQEMEAPDQDSDPIIKNPVYNSGEQKEKFIFNNNKQHNKEYNVMIVDDQQFNIIALRNHLNQYSNFKIDEFNFAEQALEQFKVKHYDIVFSDIQMPILDGIEFVKKVRSLEQNIAQPFIIMVTADSSQEYIQQLDQLKVYEILQKPILDRNKFQILIDEILTQI